jgi:hypothetical protein
MKRKKILFLLFMIMATLEWQCIDKYSSPYQSPATGYLVVEGYITSNRPTQFTLSRTIPLPGDSGIPMETGAKVQVEGSDNSIYPLTEQNAGIYVIDTLALNTTTQYRLRISTADGQQYLSRYTPYQPTPPIDSISWAESSSGVTIYANTHGPAGATGYYQWTYNETWEYSASQPTDYIWDTANSTIIGLTIAQLKAICWHSDSSTDIIVASTAKLSQDLIYEQPVQTIAIASQQLGIEYSILVRQYALTDSAYAFLTLMQQNTESLGSIFDPQPSQLTGNIQCLTTPSQPVIGWVSAGTIQQQRIFISRSQVPDWGYFNVCSIPIHLVPADSLVLYFTQFGYVPLGPLQNGSAPGVAQGCTDCTLQGGTTTKPSFWPN